MLMTTLLTGCLLVTTQQTSNVPAVAPPEDDSRWLFFEGDADMAPGNGRRVVLVSGDEEYRSEECLPMLGRLLAGHGYEAIVLFSQDPETGEIDPENLSHIPGLHLVDDADVLVLQLRFRELPDEDMKHIVNHVEAGKPVIGIRTSTHAFNYIENRESPYVHWTWNSTDPPGGFGGHVLGETWVNHHGHHGVEATRGVPHPGNEAHPVLRGVTDVFGPTDVYGIRGLPEDSTVLLDGAVLTGMDPGDPPVTGPKNDPMHPVAWVRERTMPDGSTQRIVATTMGTAEDFSSHDLRRLMLNGVTWCAGNEQAIPPDGLDAPVVGPWDPTPFGFGTHRTGYVPLQYRHGSPWVNEAAAEMIADRIAAFTRAVAEGDADQLVSLYTEHAIVLPPGQGVAARGRDEIRSMFQANFDAGLRWIDLQPEDVHVVTDGIVMETGRYRIGPAPGTVMDAGSYSVTWKRIDGRWLIDRDVIISAAPGARPN